MIIPVNVVTRLLSTGYTILQKLFQAKLTCNLHFEWKPKSRAILLGKIFLIFQNKFPSKYELNNFLIMRIKV